MIDAKELRIGNIVQVLGVYKDSINKAGLIAADAEFIRLVEQKKCGALPFELTPDLLEKAGFAKDGFNAYNICISPWPNTHLKQLSFSGDYLYLREGELKDGREKDSICVLWNNDLRGKMALHQIQNLYLDLTGTELNFTL